uniref:Uncharacterized protein n=1 Tax=Cacopsylla melanoneura TaxID=428564 RepID=A0A8D8R895_9HEMI
MTSRVLQTSVETIEPLEIYFDGRKDRTLKVQILLKDMLSSCLSLVKLTWVMLHSFLVQVKISQKACWIQVCGVGFGWAFEQMWDITDLSWASFALVCLGRVSSSS